MIPKIPEKLTSRTPFYGRLALVIGEHPHKGKIGRCIGAFKWAKHWYVVFKNDKLGIKFAISDPSCITWVEEKKDKEEK